MRSVRISRRSCDCKRFVIQKIPGKCKMFRENDEVQVSIHQRHMEQWKTLFTNSCLSEADVTARFEGFDSFCAVVSLWSSRINFRCATLPITPSLCASSGTRLPIHSMAELMSANAFTKHSVDISVRIRG